MDEKTVILLTPADGENVELCTEKQRLFLNLDRSDMKLDDLTEFRLAHKLGDWSGSCEVVFTLEKRKAGAIFELSETSDFSDSMKIKTAENRISVPNLKTGCEYYWRVNGCSARHFVTKEGIRHITVPGATNVRDLGGYRTRDGHRIREGLLYRGGSLDNVQKEGIRVLTEDLGIKTEIDFRAEGTNPLSNHGVCVEKIILMGVYEEFPRATYPEIRAFYELLANEARYPVYFHCAGGADRTGCMAAMTEMLLGVSEEDIFNDYEFTTVANVGAVCRNNSEKFALVYRILTGLPGDTQEEKIAQFLINTVGVSEKVIGKIHGILLEECRS